MIKVQKGSYFTINNLESLKVFRNALNLTIGDMVAIIDLQEVFLVINRQLIPYTKENSGMSFEITLHSLMNGNVLSFVAEYPYSENE